MMLTPWTFSDGRHAVAFLSVAGVSPSSSAWQTQGTLLSTEKYPVGLMVGGSR